MNTVQTITKAVQGIGTMEAYGMVNGNLAGLAITVLTRVAQAEDVDAALDAAIIKWENEIAMTADWGTQNRFQYTLDTLKGLK